MSATAASMLIQALRAAGVEYVFANLGSDHPALIEALAADRASGLETPRVVICPHEFSALSAAHGYALVTGRPQAVFVHTDVGTANLGGAVHNAARARVPVLVFAGLTPYTLEGEEPGGRDTHITFLQDAPDQHGLVRPYAKWSYDLRTASNVPQVVLRALQLSRSAPAGPVYLTGAREVLAQTAEEPAIDPRRWPAIAPTAAPPSLVDALLAAIEGSAKTTIVTTYLGRNPAAVAKLTALAERLGIGVVEYNAEVLSFPHDHPLHLGDDPAAGIAGADVVIALDTDVPWIPGAASPAPGAHVYVVNEDPLQERLPLWYLPAEGMIRADAETFLDQLLARCTAAAGDPLASARRETAGAASRATRTAWRGIAEADLEAGRLTPASIGALLSSLLDEDAVLVNEGITAAPDIWRHVPRRRPGTVYGNRGTSLGWSGGGALGVKLADPARTVVSVVGDGTYFFGAPASSAWIAAHYGLAVLTIVLDNGGWNATRRNAARQYPDGTAVQTDRFWVNLGQSADLPGIARAAGGGWGATVAEIRELERALREGLAQVERGVPATIAVRMDPISRQADDDVASSHPHSDHDAAPSAGSTVRS